MATFNSNLAEWILNRTINQGKAQIEQKAKEEDKFARQRRKWKEERDEKAAKAAEKERLDNYGTLIPEGEQEGIDGPVDLFAITSESVVLANQIDSKPIHYAREQQLRQRLSEHIELLPTVITVQGELHSWTWDNALGRDYWPNVDGYVVTTNISQTEVAERITATKRKNASERQRPVEKLEQLVKARESTILWTYYSTITYGGPIKHLHIKEVSFRHSTGPTNIIPFTLVLQSVENKKLNPLEGFYEKMANLGTKTLTGAGAGAGAGALAGWILGGPLGVVPGAIIGGILGAGAGFIAGLIDFYSGSVPWQTLTTPILGHDFTFELRWDTISDEGVFSMRDANGPIITETSVRYGQDLLANSQHDPRVRGLHIVAAAMDGRVRDLTEDTLLKQIRFYVIQEATEEQLLGLVESGAEVVYA